MRLKEGHTGKSFIHKIIIMTILSLISFIGDIMKALDLFCGAGGSAMGLYQAGFKKIIGVDIENHKDYPFEFIRADACLPPVNLESFDFIWASPPCQAYSIGTQRFIDSMVYPRLADWISELLSCSNIPYVIENVPGAPIRKDIFLTGGMFNKNLERRRVFEISGFRVEQPKYRQPLEPLCTVAGHGGNSRTFKFKDWCNAMSIDWMVREDLKEAIPPYYSKFIGEAFIRGKKSDEQ